MINATEKAIKRIKDIAAQEDIKDIFIRAKIIGGGCAGFQYDLYFEDIKPTDFDEVFDIDGVKIVVDPLSFQYLDGSEIDWIESAMSAGFKVNSPNVSKVCGCGSSVQF